MARVQRHFTGESRVEQSHRDKVNINSIMRRHNLNKIRPVKAGDLMFGDFSTAEDYKATMDKVARAKQSFMSLPSDLRKRFDNDPAQLLTFVTDDGNYEEAIELGLIEKPQPDSSDESVGDEPVPGSEAVPGTEK